MRTWSATRSRGYVRRVSSGPLRRDPSVAVPLGDSVAGRRASLRYDSQPAVRAARPPRPRCPPLARSRRGPRRAWAASTRGCRDPSAGGRPRARRDVRRHRLECAARAAGRSAAIATSTLPTHQPSRGDAARDLGEQPDRRRAAVAPSSDAGNSVPRSGRPAGPSSASATACATASASEWPASAGRRRRSVTPPSTSAPSVAERMDVEAEADADHRTRRPSSQDRGGDARGRPAR